MECYYFIDYHFLLKIVIKREQLITIDIILYIQGGTMKKTLMVIISTFTLFLHGMEKLNFFAYVHHGTLIRVTKGHRRAIYGEDGEVDVIVVGQKEQKQLSRVVTFKDVVGKVSKKRRNSICTLREFDIPSHEDGNPVESIKHKAHNFCRKDMQSSILFVVEPYMYNPFATKERKNYFYENKSGNEAIKKASDDLALRCNNVLMTGLKILGTKKNKTIAMPMLSATLDFPIEDVTITMVTSIINFVQNNRNVNNNPAAYWLIHLFVETEDEFEWCRRMLDVYTRIIL